MTAPYTQPLLETPLHARTAPLCLTGDWARWGGYTTVNSYGTVELEFFANTRRRLISALELYLDRQITVSGTGRVV